MSYTDLTIKTIYGRSYNECNHPDCTTVIIAVDPNTEKVVNHGEMAHIRARKAGEERWDSDYPTEKLNLADNLILLCTDHHLVIDQKGAGDHYTVPLLEEWKAKHYLAKEIAEDRSWVYGSSSVTFAVDGQQQVLEFWCDAQGNIRFFTDKQLAQAKAARELSYIFAQLGGLMRMIDDADPTPANPSHITLNDGMLQIICRDVARLRRSSFNSAGTEYETFLHRLHANLKACPDITLAELSLVGTVDKMPTTSVLVGGELTQERLLEAMQPPKRKDET